MKTTRILLPLFLSILFVCSACTYEPVTSATSFDGVEINFSNQGKGEPVIVLVHGWTNNKSIWDGQVAHFSEDYNVIAIDLAGHGASGTNRSDWTMEAYGKDVVAVVEAVEAEEVVLVGFSMGGAVVVEAATILGDRVSGIVFADNMHDPDEIVPPPVMHWIDSVFMDLISNPSLEKLLQYGFFRNNPEKELQI